VSWGRGSCPTLRSQTQRTAASRATPITLAVRADLPWLLAAARIDRVASETSEATACVLACLTRAGALFFSQLVVQSGLSELQVRDALWDGVARGLVSADGFEALRNLIAPRTAAGSVFGQVAARAVLRQGARAAPQGEGRWALLSAADDIADREVLAEAVAEQLVARWGVVFRDVVAGESLGLPWREIIQALRRLETRGVLRGGHFVAGFVGEQYAAPEAVELLRAVRREPRRGVRVELAACDPLNLTGMTLLGPRVAATSRNTLGLSDGALVTSPPPTAALPQIVVS
jgi:ATP-dependent helicase Lhr and Lhr-like helicase